MELLNGQPSVSVSQDLSTQGPCWIDKIPAEILSEILLAALNNYGDIIRIKWGFPLLIRRVSRRFYHITTNTHSLWRYLYINHPIHPYLHKHISHSGSLSLVVRIIYDVDEVEAVRDEDNSNENGSNEEDSDNEDDDGEESDDEDDNEGPVWREMVKTLTPILPRVASLSLHSPANNGPIVELLRLKMPILHSLDVEGVGLSTYHGHSSSLSHLPALRRLESRRFFHFEGGLSALHMLEELYLRGEVGDSWRQAEHLWGYLPPTIRVLEIEDIAVALSRNPPNEMVRLPSLTALRLSESCIWSKHSVLQFLDAPHLRSLNVSLSGWEAGTATSGWSLDFPELTHLKWESRRSQSLQFQTLIGRCNSLIYTCIKAEQGSKSMEDFLIALAEDANFLPRLEGLKIYGASPVDLKKMLQARPQLHHLGILRKDMKWKDQTGVGGYEEWGECKAWLESHTNVYYFWA